MRTTLKLPAVSKRVRAGGAGLFTVGCGPIGSHMELRPASILRRDRLLQPDQPFQVLRQRRQQRLFLHPLEGSQAHPPQPHEVLRLTEQLLDLFSEALRERVAPTAGLALRPLAQRLRLLLDRMRWTSDMRPDPAPSQ